MKQLIDPKSAERVLLFIAVAGPLIGLTFGALLGAHTRRARVSVLTGVLIGCLGPLVYGLWHVYGAITDAFGLDSVANLVLQLILFAAIGGLLGVAVIRLSMFLKRLWS